MNFCKRHIFAILGLLFLTIGYAPIINSLVNTPLQVGPGDWELYSSYVETFRKIVQDFGQFPWWNPYSSGGYPYFGNPLTFGALSLPHALSLVIGSLPALKLSVFISAIFGFFGMYILAGRFTDNRLYRAAAAVLFACNGGIVIHFSVGHMFWDYFFYPWIIHCLMGLNELPSSRTSVKLSVVGGLMLGLSVHSAIHYGFIYQLITIVSFFVAGAWQYRRQRTAVLHLLQSYVLMGLVFIAVGASRIIICQEVMKDYPRVQRWEMNAGLLRTLKIYFYPLQSIHTDGGSPLGWWEWGCYVGVPAAALFLYSMRRKIRFFHVAFFVALLLYFKNERPWPYYWLSTYAPLFKSMRIAARIRIWAIPFFAMGVIVGLQSLKSRKLAQALAVLVMADISLVSWHTLSAAFRGVTENTLSDSWPTNTHAYPLTYQDKLGQGSGLHRSLRQNFAHTPGYEPAIAPPLWLKPVESLSLTGFNSPTYRGEFYTEAGPVEPEFWSPNKIIFKGIHQPLSLNMNLGSYWTVNGQAVFQQQRVAEVDRQLTVDPNENGTIVLEVSPKGLEPALLASAVALLLAIGLACWRWTKESQAQTFHIKP
jgi:hypothetical protein